MTLLYRPLYRLHMKWAPCNDYRCGRWFRRCPTCLRRRGIYESSS